MLLTLQATPAQIARAKEVYSEDHASFYGQPMTFLHAELDSATVTEIKRVFNECVAHGYLPI